MILLGVQDAEHDDAVTNDLVRNLVGKPTKNDPAEVEVIKPFAFWFVFQATHRNGY